MPSLPWKAIEELAQEAAARAAEIEEASRLPRDLLERVHAGGFMRMGLPARQGGWAATPAECFRACVSIATGDGSLGWQVAAVTFFHSILAAVASPRLQMEFLDDRNALLAGGVIGKGSATRVGDEYEVEGAWDFSTGCWDATWLGGFCLERPAEGPPGLLFVMVPAARAKRRPSWDVIGLRGTSSDTVVLPRQVVPADWTFPYPTPLERALPAAEPISSFGRGVWPTASAAAATQLGIARRAIDEVVAFARTKHRPGTGGPLISEQAFQRDLFAAEGVWRAAHRGVDYELERLWSRACEGQPIDVDTRIRVRLAATHAAQAGAHIVRTCFDLGGATVIGRQHPLARCHRDGTILNHHGTVSVRTLEMLARVSLGLEPDSPMV